VDWKPERAIQAKVRDLQKIIQKMMMKTKTEASQFKWVEWKNALCAGFQMATSAKVVELMGCYPFDEWINGPYPISWFEYGLYPHQLVWKWIWIWALPHRLVWIWVLPHMWLVWRALPRQCFGSSPEMLPPIKNAECLYCDIGLLPFWTCPILPQRSYHYTILWVSYMFIHSCICSMHANIIHAWLHY